MMMSKARREEKANMTEEMTAIKAEMDELGIKIYRGVETDAEVVNAKICELNEKWTLAGGLGGTCLATYEEIKGLPVDKESFRINRGISK